MLKLSTKTTAVISFGEYRLQREPFWQIRQIGSAQLCVHNPRKQREILAAAKLGETFFKGKWRRERDCGLTFSGA